MIGIYSAKQAELTGTSIYRRPDGSAVEVTCICPDPSGCGCKWDDKVNRGEVTAWVRSGKPKPQHEFAHG